MASKMKLKSIKKVKDNSLEINLNNEQEIDKLFDIGKFPDPDILIRIRGYKRLSNFIMYNLTYTELFFTDTFGLIFLRKNLMILLKNIQISEENMVYKNFLLRSLFAVIILSIYFIISYIDFNLVFYLILLIYFIIF